VNQVELKKQTAHYFLLKGRLVFDTVDKLVQTSLVQPNTAANHTSQPAKEAIAVTLDCHQLSHMDSAGIALLLEWKRQLAGQGQCLILKNLPQQAQAIIHATRLDYLLNASNINHENQP